MCKRLSDRDVGYLSLSGDYGLKSIKIIDARYTAVGNQLLSSMYKSPTLQELYFQCYSSTYQLDRTRRKLAIHRGAQQEPHSYRSDDEESIDTNKRRMIKRFGDVPLRTCKTDIIDDGGVAMFKYVESSDAIQERPKSFLFKYPYAECKCGYYKHFWENRSIDRYKKPKPDCSSSDSDDDETIKLKHLIRKRRRQLKVSLKEWRTPPLYYVLYNAKVKENNRMMDFQWINERPPETEEEMEMLEHTIVETPPDEGIIICGLNGHQYSSTREGVSFLLF